MGQQQLLLIVLGVIIVGISIVAGISLFQNSAIDANRNAIIEDLHILGSNAQAYFRRPANFGGGGNSFVGYSLPPGFMSNANGTYSIKTAGTATQIIFQGVGTEKGDNGTTGVTHTATVTANTVAVAKVN